MLKIHQLHWLAQPKSEMTKELAGLEIAFAYVDISSCIIINSQSRNKSQIPDVPRENNLASTPATNNTHDDNDAATSSNL